MKRRNALNFDKSNKTRSYLFSPSFPGPVPYNLEMFWNLRSRGSVTVYMESFKITPDSCDRASLVIRRQPLSSKWRTPKTFCSPLEKNMTGHLGNGFRFRLELKAKNVSKIEFKLRFERES